MNHWEIWVDFEYIILKNNNWETIFTIAQNEGFSESATEWELLNLDITEKNYGIKMIIDEITSAHSDMGFSNFYITHSIYWSIWKLLS